MERKFKKALFYGAMIFAMGTLNSCSNDDLDELKTKVAVLETAINDIKSKLNNALTTGASVVSATKDESGKWIIELSNGEKIEIGTVINNGDGNSGSNVTIVITDKEAIFTIDGVEYKLPLGSKINSLVYCPEYSDAKVITDNEGYATVKFLARPALSSIDGAQFSIASSYELKSRAGSTQFVVKESTLDGDFINVKIRALGVEASEEYAVSLQMDYAGTIIGSDFFDVKISEGFTFDSEDLVDPVFAPGVEAAKIDGTEYWTAKIPDNVNFLGTFNFKDLVSISSETFAEVGYEFELGSLDEQNTNVSSRYAFFSKCLKSDGEWTMNGRPGTNCNKLGEEDKHDGILIYVKQNDQIKSKIYWTVNNPIENVDFIQGFIECGVSEIEYGEGYDVDANKEGTHGMIEGKVQSIDFLDILYNNKVAIQYGDAQKVKESLKNYTVQIEGKTVISVNANGFVIDEDFKNKYMSHSKGFYWEKSDICIAASCRRNWDITDDERIQKGYNGETIVALNTSADEQQYGLSISDKGLETSANYQGWAVRAGVNLKFEYDYGEVYLRKDVNPTMYYWFNRRLCPEGVVDPQR